ncbi:lipoprotein, putative [Syntrophotalea carbinolica DSM 2380]|uniref:Lipoprotein, putative n=1 Tax=Syntrophotalea carbinolica (strain DSM 2380 / NBRC 103641 / GraBd1) TaxID=338963 RepID=Q3A390_SYNC1|nr:hypothetical protein [Syntrophotalea carbinolica]ABA89167.1 lipoprotein, putative [Syntrophotalea carbinolica DSM 2380]
MKISRLVVFGGLLVLLAGCTTYRSQEVPFRSPASYGNMQTVAGAQLASKAFVEKTEASKVFGFDIRSAGLLPVQVVFDNQGSQALAIVPEQSFLIDNEGNLWNLLDSRTAYTRIEKSSEYARIAKGGGKGAMLGAAGGAVLGAAIGILSGENVGSALFKGAAVGGAGGAVVGGTQGATDDDAGRQIARDLANKSLVNQGIQPGGLAHGFLFFPGEAISAAQLRLQITEIATGRVYTVLMPLR